MGTASAMLFIAILVGSNATSKNDKVDPNLYISNWAQYGLPGEIEAGVLRKILHEISAFKRTSYCPIGKTYDSCVQSKLSAIITNIVKTNIEESIQNKTIKDTGSLKEYILYVDDKAIEGFHIDYGKCHCKIRHSVEEEEDEHFKLTLICECQQVEAFQFAALSTYDYIKVDPEGIKSDSYIKNRLFGQIIGP